MKCSICNADITVGFGGESNLQRHENSAPCKLNQAKNRKKDKNPRQNRSITEFFKKLVRAVSPTVSSPAPVKPMQINLNSGSERGDTPSTPLSRQSSVRCPPESSAGDSPEPFSCAARSTSPSLINSLRSGYRSSSPDGMDGYEPATHQFPPKRTAPNTTFATSHECPGIQVIFPEGQNQHLSYPFGIHAKHRLPWGYRSEDERFFVRSTSCLKSTPSSAPCRKCEALRKNDVFITILQRIFNGIDPHTPNLWFPIGGLL
ncbi:hypothetical protein DFH09DRAFT_1039079, partial [Mycena vulgaris]